MPRDGGEVVERREDMLLSTLANYLTAAGIERQRRERRRP
jgi:hypothetical protein